MTLPENAITKNSKWFFKRVLGGLLVGVMLFTFFMAYTEVTSRPTRLPGSKSGVLRLSDIPPFLDGQWIKIPFDRVRDEECLTQSTLSLTRAHDYPDPLGHREDDIVIALRNTPFSGMGDVHKLIWSHLPDDVPAGTWELVVDAGRECKTLLSPATDSGPIKLGEVTLGRPER